MKQKIRFFMWLLEKFGVCSKHCVYLSVCVQAVVVYDWKQGRMCQSFQGHSREVTKVKSILRVQPLIKM